MSISWWLEAGFGFLGSWQIFRHPSTHMGNSSGGIEGNPESFGENWNFGLLDPQGCSISCDIWIDTHQPIWGIDVWGDSALKVSWDSEMAVGVHGNVSETDYIARDEVSWPLWDPEELGSWLEWEALSALYLWILERWEVVCLLLILIWSWPQRLTWERGLWVREFSVGRLGSRGDYKVCSMVSPSAF